MAKHKRRQSEFEVWVDLLARLPWQLCLILVPVAWLGFHMLSQIAPPAAMDVSQLSGTVVVTMLKTAGLFLQFLVPSALLLAALGAWLAKRKRAKLLVETEQRTGSAPLLELSWQEFEQLVAAYFERQGYQVNLSEGGADGGVDAVARKQGETFLIQCKQWRATQVGVTVVRELFGVMSAQGATGAWIVSAGPFTKAAAEFANGRNIRLLDARKFVDKTLRSSQAQSTPSAQRGIPDCPKCSSPMIKRIARQGKLAGQSFWGCSQYPKCHGTRNSQTI